MPEEAKGKVRLEIAHVLFVDIVGYSKLLISEQSELLGHLNEMVRASDEVLAADAHGKLIRLATGDGMALVFRSSPEAPVRCAVELARADKQHPELELRMGIHSGLINEIVDVNDRANVAGAGINLAQRVMDCGDAGHILVSQRVAEDLEQYEQWRPLLHELGEVEVKHGSRLRVVNFYDDEVGNPAIPEKFRKAAAATETIASTGAPSRKLRPVPLLVGAALLALSAAALLWWERASIDTATALQPVSAPRAASRSSTPAVSEKSIAVLPFENLSKDEENAFFTNGVQDEILADLAKVADLKVISHTSVMQYKSDAPRNLRQIGQELGVAHVLEGSVQRINNRVRVTAQLIDARTDRHLWADHYDRELADVFAIQSEIAKTIADQLQAKILPSEKLTIERQPTRDLAAYELYARATDAIDGAINSGSAREDLLRAVPLLEQAIQHDPAFFAAYCALARAHDRLYLIGGDHTPARLAAAEQALNAAGRLQPDAGEMHLAQAMHLYSELDYDNARTQIELARRTLPNEPKIFELTGYIDRRQGRWPESTDNFERALQLDPNNTFVLEQIALSYVELHDYGRAAAAYDRVLALIPGDIDARLARAQVEVFWKADTKPLHEVMEAFLREQPAAAAHLSTTMRVFLVLAERDASAARRVVADLGDNTYGPHAVQLPGAFVEGIFARLTGDAAAAEESFARARATQEQAVDAQPDYGPALCGLGLIDAGLGRKDAALREGRRAAELMPPAKDSINGPNIMQFLAIIEAWVGERDLAIEELARAVELPGSVSYGELRLLPLWDPLRDDPRFEKIVASLAPK